MPNDDASPQSVGRHVGYLASRHDRFRFTEFGELLLARVLLQQCADRPRDRLTSVSLALSDIFKGASWRGEDLGALLKDQEFEVSHKTGDIVAAFMSALTGIEVGSAKRTFPAAEYYNLHLESRLKWLTTGDSHATPSIDDFQVNRDSELHSFEVQLVPEKLAAALAVNLRSHIEIVSNFHDQLIRRGALSQTMPRIEIWKQLYWLTELLDARQRETGERRFSFTADEFNFRRLLMTTQGPSGDVFTMQSPGTTDTSDKHLLPLLMECNGLLDIQALHVVSSPLTPEHVVVQYYVARPAVANVFHANAEGLSQPLRRSMTEDQLVVHSRIRSALDRAYIFGGKPGLSDAFAEVFHFLIRTLSISIEEPSVLHSPARMWLSQATSGKAGRVAMENDFFLPWLYERMRMQFGSRVVKQPKRFGGELDILFDDVIPIELKVRRSGSGFAPRIHGESGPKGTGQASTYASLSRVAFLLTLDVPANDDVPANMDGCVKVFEQRPAGSDEFPTCIISMVFQCRLRSPSQMPD